MSREEKDHPATHLCRARIQLTGWKLPHPPYSPDVTSLDFNLFGLIKYQM